MTNEATKYLQIRFSVTETRKGIENRRESTPVQAMNDLRSVQLQVLTGKTESGRVVAQGEACDIWKKQATFIPAASH
jgi:hypothetical protein